ncbi:MAG: glycosyltransferase family 39 protein [Saprospiraceae bacterium]
MRPHNPASALERALLLLAVVFIAALFLPRVLTQGMFGDGLLYASMARNLAEGKGSYWAPFFSSGYWVPGLPVFYQENPPLMLWIQSLFFHALGDHWWVEKLYSALLLALNCLLLCRIWEIPLRGTAHRERHTWLPLLLFYLIPTVIWGAPNNLMDTTMLAFCLLAVHSATRAVFFQNKTTLWLMLTGLFVFLGLLTKGPVALYPVAAPFLFAVALPDRNRWLGLGQSVFAGGVVLLAFATLLALVPPAREFFQNYWEQRLSVALAGGREDGLHTGWGRLNALKILLMELLPMFIVSVLFWATARRQKPDAVERAEHWRTALFFALLGFAGTLPLLASTRQTAMYLTASLPMFALAAGYFHLPVLRRVFDLPQAKKSAAAKRVRQFAVAALAALAFFLVTIAGKPGREKALLRDVEALRKIIPEGSLIGACEALAGNFYVHTYLQRFLHVEISRDIGPSRYFATNPACEPVLYRELEQAGFKETIFEGETLAIRQKQREGKNE